MSQLTKEESKEHAGLVRDIVAACKVSHPSDNDRAFRIALMKRADKEAPTMEVHHIRRLHEAACEIEYPEPQEQAFREAMAAHLAQHHRLKELRAYTIARVKPAPHIVTR